MEARAVEPTASNIDRSTARWRRRRRSHHGSHLETNDPPPPRARSNSLQGPELEEWWSLTPDRLKRIFSDADADRDGRLLYSVLVESLRRYDLDGELEGPSWSKKKINQGAEVTMVEFEAAARQLMMEKVLLDAARAPPTCCLVDFSETESDMPPDRVAVTRDFLTCPRPYWSRTRWYEIRGSENALKLLGIKYALHPLAIEDALRATQRPKEERYDTHSQIIVPRFVVVRRTDEPVPRVHTENVSIFVPLLKSETLVTYSPETVAPAWSRRVRSELSRSFTKLREEGAAFLAYRVLDAVLDSGAPAVATLRDAVAEQRAILRKSGFGDATVGPALRSLKADLEDLSRLVRPLLRVLGNLLADDDVVDHRYNNYIEDASENCAELEEDIQTGLREISWLVQEIENFYKRKQDQTIYALTVTTVIFLPLQFITGLFGMNFRYMPQLNDRPAYYVLLACMGIYVVVCVLLIGICGQWNKRLPIDLPPDDLEAGRRRASTFL
mmetsp:Transcript_24647/g.76022  ORF Transcript_24647/g.76022 Transcript_24647/m.76022 type:complete len:499 (-) Transcript_24647:51-1547(-)